MTDNINVKPGRGGNVKSVATDNVDEVHYPLYKLAIGEDGEASLVSVSNALPVTASDDDVARHTDTKDILSGILMELRIMNAYNAMGFDEELTEKDL